METVKRSSYAVRTCAIVGIAAAIGALLAIRSGPTLLRAFGDTGCACGDYHAKVTGLTILNPFRDRSPEIIANDFLADLRANKCSASQKLCGYALPEHRISDWRLVGREDTRGLVALFFKLTKYHAPGLGYDMTGEGTIQLRQDARGWRVVFYSSYF